ncbi:MAG: tetratricopeptide repeat protein, partial [Pseudomonadota bacterium]
KRADFFDAYNNLGACYIELQRFDEGLDAYAKAVDLKPDYVPALRNYGAALRDVGRLDEAEKILEKIPVLQPEFALGFLSLGVTKAKLEKMDEAAECLEQALKLEPEMREAHYELGKVFKYQGDMNKALEHFEKVDSMIARVQVLELLHDMGNRDELLPRLKKLCDAEPKNLRAAAFSAYASHQYEMDNLHSFARDPMDLVSVSDLSDRLDYSPRMLTELMLAADELTTVWQHATTRGGTQTHGNLFDPALQNEQFSKLEKLIRKELRGYREKFKDCPDGIINDFPRDFTLKGWRVKLMKAGFQKPHIHSGGWISGVLYLKIPKQIEGNEGSIAFSL